MATVARGFSLSEARAEDIFNIFLFWQLSSAFEKGRHNKFIAILMLSAVFLVFPRKLSGAQNMKVTAKKCSFNRCGTPLITRFQATLFTAVFHPVSCKKQFSPVQRVTEYLRVSAAVQCSAGTVAVELVSVKVTWAALC